MHDIDDLDPSTYDRLGERPDDAYPLWNLGAVVAGLRRSRDVTSNIRHPGASRQMPSREALGQILDALSAALFPSHYGRSDLAEESIDYFVGETLNNALGRLREQVRRGLAFGRDPRDADAIEIDRQATEITRKFASRLPSIRAVLVTDLRAAYAGDPAATSLPEIMLGYPGMSAVIRHRLAHALFVLGATLAARLIASIAHSQTGIDIHPGAQIGASFFIDHGTGVVIGETTVIGERVRLYQAVTLGARHFPAEPDGSLIKGHARHPVVEDDVVIYAGATVLGRITIGRGSTIGGNVWLTQSVPPGSNVTQAQMRNIAG